MKFDERPDTDDSDEELVARARSGDDASMSALVMRHQAAAFRAALSLTRDADTAQDVVQDAFLKVFRALDTFRGDASFRTWLLTIAGNEARGVFRKMKRRGERALESAGPLVAGGPAVGDMTELKQEAGKAREMVATLPDKQRLAVTLRIDEGLSFREIGEIIGSSEGAARVNYHHGIRRLREMMT